jgi:hypothetical protein
MSRVWWTFVNPEAVIRPDGYVAWVAGGTDTA